MPFPPSLNLRQRPGLLVGVAILAALATWLVARAQQPTVDTDHARWHGRTVEVADVIEGDRLRLADGTALRLLGVDAHGRDDARELTSATLAESESRVTLYLEPVPTRTAAGDLLAYAFVGDTLLNEMLITAGAAFADRRLDHAYAGHFEQLEQTTAYKRIGVWHGFPDVPDADMPEWRRRWLAEFRKPPWERIEWRRADEP